MRLRRLRIRNFRTFVDVTLDLGSSTVLVGANDSGKSTVVDALAWLFWGHDRDGRLPTAHRDMFQSGRAVTLLEISEQGIPFPSFVMVTGEFADLSDRERRIWAPLIDEDHLVFGRKLDGEDDGTELNCVGSAAVAKRLLSTTEGARDLEREEASALLGEYFEVFEGGVWLSLDTLADAIFADVVPFWPEPRPDPFTDFPARSGLVLIRGPEFGGDAAKELLRPLVARLIRSALRDTGGALADRKATVQGDDRGALIPTVVEAADKAIAKVSEAYSTSLPRWATNIEGAVVYRQSDYGVSERVIDTVIGDLAIDIVAADPAADGYTSWDGEGRALDQYGAGTKRAGAIAALELFRDPDIWPPDQNVLLAVEEPEVGLHPGAQRRVATALAGLSTFGVQTVVVTHSPVFVNAAPLDGLRLVRASRRAGIVNIGSTIVQPDDLTEIVHDLDVRPSDVLLARGFVIVEGESDALILSAWARVLGQDLQSAGIQIVASGGHTTAAIVARFVSIAYEGADVLVLLDQGRDTEKTRREIDSRFGNRVTTRLLAHQEIEGYFSSAAVERWLIENGVEVDQQVRDALTSALAGPNYKRGLRDLSARLMGREYRTTIDGSAIASLSREPELDPEMRGLLSRLLAGPPISG
jgi:energy-coupling factor transporter ATP-binding protein EcfA2